MKRMLFNATYQEELRVATVEGRNLINFDIETTSKTQRRGNIYKGVITRVEPSLEACFVDYGTDKQGFLPFKEIDASYLAETARHRDFNRLPEGTELIIQVEKDERGNKGAALTTYISMPGRYLVLMPNNSRSGGISRRIDGDERDELKSVISALQIPEGMSIIARTAALGRFPEELQWDLDYLLKLWDAIKTASSNHVGSFLIYQESNLVVRSIRDHFSPDITEILIDMESIYEQARQFMSHVMPNFVDRVKLYSDDVPLFSRFQIEHQIETAYGRMVHLPSGGSIAIDHTEALTAIDVNSAKANKGSDIEATALATNMEAAEEIARQLRLRDLGGLVVVDFIDMESQKNQREVENCFKDQLGLDRARIQMGKLSRFGLLELSRQRLQASLEESTTIACPRCEGVGSIRGTESTAVHVLRIIQEEAVKNTNYISQLQVQLPVSVATYLLNEKRDDVAKIESRMKVKIVLIPNVHLDSPHYKIRKIGNDGVDALANKLSYHLVENPEENQAYQVNERKSDTSLQNNAIVKNITPSQPAPVMTKKTAVGKFLGKLMGMFKASVQNPKPANLNAKAAVEKPGIQNKAIPANPNRNNTNNKVRPVGVNRSNTKVQTVRQSNSPKPNPARNDGNEKYDNVIPNKISYKTRENERQKLASEQKPAPEAAINLEQKPVYATQPVRKQSNAPVPNMADTPGNNPDNKAVINQAWQQPSEPIAPQVAKATVETSVKEEAPTKPVVAVEKALVVNQPTPLAVKKVATAVRENTITKAIDLGSFELVSTTNTSQPVIKTAPAPVKRYNDVIVKNVAVNEDVNYELVETKAN